jgi:lysophospholipase L1-like esterase
VNHLKNIVKFIKNVNYTSIILMSIPYRYYIMDYSYVNRLMKSFNSKFSKFAEAFNHLSIMETMNNRLLFTKHGLHLNELGKALLSDQLALHIFSLLEEVNSTPTILRWHDKNLKASDSSIVKPSRTHI